MAIMKRILLMFVLFAQLSANIFAQEIAMDHPNRTYVNETIPVIKAKGFVKLQGTTVSKYLYVYGRLKAMSATIEQMQSVGPTVLLQCIVKKKSLIQGPLIISYSIIEEELTVGSEKATFNASNISSIFVAKITAPKNPQVIELNEKTVVHGPIIFASGEGIVILHSGSKILGGVIGGTVLQQP